MLFSLFILLTVIIEKCSSELLSHSSINEPSIRLSRDLLPIHYKVEIQSEINPPFSYSGKVEIKILCNQTTNKIVLHSKAIKINLSEIIITAVAGRKAPIKVISLKSNENDKLGNFLSFNLKGKLYARRTYFLSFSFNKSLPQDSLGLFLQSYKDDENKLRYYIGTHFQAIFARRAFPCFDEPNMKATFEIILVHPKHLTALFNTDIIYSEERNNNLIADYFSVTPLISTYLLAIVIGEFSKVEITTESHVTIRFWGRKSILQNSGTSTAMTLRIFTFFENYFKIPYPLTKLDIVALPEFQTGAMENWGLILMREEYFIYNPQKNSFKQQENNCIVMAHEISHQWFGNLVSPLWWDSLWLNEGFATFLHYTACLQLNPKWNLNDEFLSTSQSSAFIEDSSRFSYPIKMNVKTYQDILGLFNPISYYKGAAIIYMIEDLLGKSAFEKGLNKYLRKMKYKNAQEDDLWHYLSQAIKDEGVNIDLKILMKPWIIQNGYPLITVIRNYVNGSATVKQEKYSRASVIPSLKWNVPISLFFIKQGNEFNNMKWLYNYTGYLKNLPLNQWILINKFRKGFYRVNYDTLNWKLLIEQLRGDFKKISVENRAQLLDDGLSLARIGRVDYNIAFQLTDYLKTEFNYLPWRLAINSLDYIRIALSNHKSHKHFRTYLKKLLLPIYNKLKWKENQSEYGTTRRLRPLAIEIMCKLNHHPCILEAQKMFTAWKVNPENYSISIDVQEIVFCYGIRYGNDDDWNILKKFALSIDISPTQQIIYLKALTCSTNRNTLKRYLNDTLHLNNIKKQHVNMIVTQMCKNFRGVNIVWGFIRKYWKYLIERFSYLLFSLNDVFYEISKMFYTEEKLKQIEDFFETTLKDSQFYEPRLQKYLDQIEENIIWRKQHLNEVVNWLNATIDI